MKPHYLDVKFRRYAIVMFEEQATLTNSSVA